MNASGSKGSGVSRRRLLLGAAAIGAAPWVHASPSANASFPQRPISLWVPWPAGGATDLSLRLLADLAGRQLGQKVVIENRGGAGGTLAMPVLQQAAPDGYTLAQMPHPVFRAPHIQRVAWDPIRDSTPILQVSGVTFGVVVPAASPLRSIEDLLALAAARPGELSIATNGIGTTPHVVLDQLFGGRGLEYIHVPYKGTAEQMVAVASGQVMAGVNSNGFAPYVDSGRLRLLATFGAARTRRWPDVPTLHELGHGIVAMSPYGLAGPRGMPAGIVATLHDAFKAALFDPVHVAELARFDQEVSYLGSADYGRSMRESFAAERRAVERLGLALAPG
jgi:tripartite-type tricarboxylate transporter receptor subunit TctC